MLPSLVESGKIVVEASRMDVSVNRKRVVSTRKCQSLFLRYD